MATATASPWSSSVFSPSFFPLGHLPSFHQHRLPPTRRRAHSGHVALWRCHGLSVPPFSQWLPLSKPRPPWSVLPPVTVFFPDSNSDQSAFGAVRCSHRLAFLLGSTLSLSHLRHALSTRPPTPTPPHTLRTLLRTSLPASGGQKPGPGRAGHSVLVSSKGAWLS